MKTLGKTQITAIITLSFMLLVSCNVTKTIEREVTYQETQKKSETVIVETQLPVIKPTGKTNQSQTKGGITIAVEVIPFTLNQRFKEEKTITFADPSKSGYDIYEKASIPGYLISPNNIQFKIRIRNNEQVPLKLSEVGFAIIIDGLQWSFPSGYMDDWNKGLVLTGFEKEYIISGPQLEGLYSAQVVYLFLNGVPTSYDEAGSVKKKDNFEWYFECKTENVVKEDAKTYTYEAVPIYREKCQKCSGSGTDPQPYKCSTCDGKGKYISAYDKKTYTCSGCKGTGKVYKHCDPCKGGGVIAYPKSTTAPVQSTTTWVGWNVNVVTNPPGAKVSVVDKKTGQYQSVAMSNAKTLWRTSSEQSYPIIIEYQGKEVKVLPYNQNGKEIPKVHVDFSSETPVVVKGRRVF